MKLNSGTKVRFYVLVAQNNMKIVDSSTEIQIFRQSWKGYQQATNSLSDTEYL